MFLYDVVTPAEIEEMYDLPSESVSRDINRGKFRESEVRKSGSTWLITKREEKRIYMGELTMIKVKDEWYWVGYHVDKELESEKLHEQVLEYMQKHNIDLDRVKEMYRDGLSEGMEDSKYLSFSQWFYEFTE